MKLFKNHKKRVEKVKDYAGKNKVFVITMLVAIVFLLFNFVFVSNDNPKIIHESEDVTISDNAEPEETAVTENTENKRETWRFYFIDLIILGAGGGFCLVMILRQRKKTKEELK